MPSSSRTRECAPSAPMRYRPRSTRSRAGVHLADRHRHAVRVLRHAHRLRGRAAARRRPGARARTESARGSAGSGTTRRQGLTASTPAFRSPMMSASLRPATVSISTMLPSGTKSLRDPSMTCVSMPAERNISSVRMWKNAARGKRRDGAQALDHQGADAVLAQEHRRRQADQAAAGDEHGCVVTAVVGHARGIIRRGLTSPEGAIQSGSSRRHMTRANTVRRRRYLPCWVSAPCCPPKRGRRRSRTHPGGS